MLLVAREKKDSRFCELMLDLPTGEGPETAPSKIATALEGPSVEMGSSLYGFYLGFAQDQAEFQHNLGSCSQTYQGGSLHSRKIHISCRSVGSAVYQRDSTPTWGTGVHSIRFRHQIHFSVLEKGPKIIGNSAKV